MRTGPQHGTPGCLEAIVATRTRLQAHRISPRCIRGHVCSYDTQGVISLLGASLRHSKVTCNSHAFKGKGLAAFASTSGETNAERQGGTHLQATVESKDSPGTTAKPTVRLREPLVLFTQSMLAPPRPPVDANFLFVVDTDMPKYFMCFHPYRFGTIYSWCKPCPPEDGLGAITRAGASCVGTIVRAWQHSSINERLRCFQSSFKAQRYHPFCLSNTTVPSGQG